MSSSAADHIGGTPITAIHADVVQSHILNRLDGPTLASTSCASAQLLSLCNDDHLWQDICTSTWPSTADPRVADVISAHHRSFYSDAFSAVRRHRSVKKTQKQSNSVPTSELISAADIFCDEKLIYSKVMVTKTLSGCFACSRFRLDLLDPKETVPTTLIFDGEEGNCMEIASNRLRVSWILIDPIKNRALNVASKKAVETRRHWLTENVQLRFATVAADCDGGLVQCAVMVTCGGREGEKMSVREVNIQVEDMEGKILCGKDSLGILEEAMIGERCRSSRRLEKENYQMFVRMKIQLRERKQNRERSLDMAFIATGLLVFFAVWIIFLE